MASGRSRAWSSNSSWARRSGSARRGPALMSQLPRKGRSMLRPCPPHTSAHPHGLALPIRQRSPQPFYRAKLESPQPPHTQGDLDEKDGNGEEQAERRSDLAEEAEAVAAEDRGADERLEQIVAERRAPDRRQWREAPPPGLPLRQENDG